MTTEKFQKLYRKFRFSPLYKGLSSNVKTSLDEFITNGVDVADNYPASMVRLQSVTYIKKFFTTAFFTSFSSFVDEAIAVEAKGSLTGEHKDYVVNEIVSVFIQYSNLLNLAAAEMAVGGVESQNSVFNISAQIIKKSCNIFNAVDEGFQVQLGKQVSERDNKLVMMSIRRLLSVS